ncbi:MAG: DUF1585 domain-containing protein [Pirellulales bacterium]
MLQTTFHRFPTCGGGHPIRSATGADLTYADRRTIEQILETGALTQSGLRSLIHAIAASPLVKQR